MMQQINLYRPIFRKQEKKFSAYAMLQAGGAVFVGVVVILVLMAWQLRGLRDDVQQADRRLSAATKRLDEASKQFGPGAKTQSLEDEVAVLERQLAARLRVRDVLARGLFSNTHGYSPFFVAFARQHVPGIWLTGFDIKGAGEDMRLQGRTTDPAQVPRFVQRLSTEQTLAGREFQVFVLSRPEKKENEPSDPYVEFMFRTKLQKEAGKS